MGTKQSTPSQRPRTFSGSGPMPGGSGAEVAVGSSGGSNTRLRARSLGHFSASTPTGFSIPPGATANGERRGTRSPDSDSSTPEEGPSFGRQFAQSLPLHLFALQGKGEYYHLPVIIYRTIVIFLKNTDLPLRYQK